MTFRQYLLAIFRKALIAPWHLAETVVTVVGIIGALLTWLVPKITPYVQFAIWAIPLALLLPLFLYRLVLAPYWLIREEKSISSDYRKNLVAIEQSRPNIIFDSIRQAQLYRPSPIINSQIPIYEPVQVWFRNHPPISDQHSTATLVSSLIDFHGKDNSKFALHVYGQWSINNPPNFVGSAQLSSTVDIPPGPLPVKLNIALKHVNDSSAYAFSKEGLTRDPDGRDGQSEIPPGKYDVTIHLQGVGVDRTFSFELDNLGIGLSLVLKDKQSDFIRAA